MVCEGPPIDWKEAKDHKGKGPHKANFEEFIDANCFDPDTVKFVRCCPPADKGQKGQRNSGEKPKVRLSFTATEAALKVIRQDNNGTVYHTSGKDTKPALMLESGAKMNRPVPLSTLTDEGIEEYYVCRG